MHLRQSGFWYVASLILGASLLLIAEDGKAAEATETRPNIVLIISDDHNNEHLGFLGHPVVHTPTLDALARRGTVFTTAHLPMSRCHPTLASFLSGRWPHQSGIYYNFGDKPLSPAGSLPNLLRDAGYATYVEGKYWEGNPREMGFSHGEGKTANTFVRQSQQALFDFIDEVRDQQPFFVWWAPMIPHTPHNPPRQYEQLYRREEIPVPSWYHGDREEFLDREHTLLAMTSWLDDGLKQLVDKLKQAGEYDDTLFVFVIDNGWANGLASKGSPFEKGVSTPIFFSWSKQVPSGNQLNQLVSTLDLYPTILSYAGIEAPEHAAGRSLRPLIEGQPDQGREVLFGAIYPAFATDPQTAENDVYALYARTERFKYILYVQDVVAARNRDYFRIQHILTDFPTRSAGDEDLYDLQTDPHELTDLADQAAHEGRLADMRRAVLRWWDETGGKPLEAGL